jgi:hypothetical protein
MLAQSRQNWGQSVAALAVALACILAVGALQVPRLRTLRRSAETPSPEALQRETESEELWLNLLEQAPSFGFDNLLADWVYLNFLQYFGDDAARQVTGYGLSPEYFEIIVDRNPRFVDAYVGLSTSITLYAAQPEKSVALMEKGLQSMSPRVPPESYYVWRYKAIDELLFLGDAQAARQSFEKAAEWASLSPDPGSQQVAEMSQQTAEFLRRDPESKLAQISAWVMVLNSVQDERARQIAINQIEALGGQVVRTEEGTVRIIPPSQD